MLAGSDLWEQVFRLVGRLQHHHMSNAMSHCRPLNGEFQRYVCSYVACVQANTATAAQIPGLLCRPLNGEFQRYVCSYVACVQANTATAAQILALRDRHAMLQRGVVALGASAWNGVFWTSLSLGVRAGKTGFGKGMLQRCMVSPGHLEAWG